MRLIDKCVDTQLLIISFALVFMLKLTRPTFSKYADSEEIFKLVEEGADLLEEAAASPTHTPALYSHFLRATLAQAQAEQMGRYSGDQTTGFPSRALTPPARRRAGGDLLAVILLALG